MQQQDFEGAVAALQDKLRTMESLVLAARAEQETTKRELEITKRELQREQQTTKRELQTEEHTTKRNVQIAKRELQTTKMELQTTNRELQASRKERQTGQESASFIAGKANKINGAGTNPLCLIKTPQFNNLPQWSGSCIYGSRFYDTSAIRVDNFLTCAVCRVPLSTSIMVPGTHTCPSGWTTQYTGMLVAAYQDIHATEYTCLDGNHESDGLHQIYFNSAFNFYYVVAVCGSLRCPPYIQNKAVLCVVCSK